MAATITPCGDGKYMVETGGIYAPEFETPFEIRLLVGGVEKSILTYSIHNDIPGVQNPAGKTS